MQPGRPYNNRYLSVVGKKYIVGLKARPYRRVTAQTAQFLEQHQAICLKELYTTQKTTANAYHSGSNRPLSMGHQITAYPKLVSVISTKS